MRRLGGRSWLHLDDEAHRVLFHSKNQLFGSHIGQMAIHDEDRVNYAGDPEEQGQDQVQNGLERFSAQEHGDRRQDDGEEVSHEINLLGLVCI